MCTVVQLGNWLTRELGYPWLNGKYHFMNVPNLLKHKCFQQCCVSNIPQEFVKATQDTFHLTLGVRFHQYRWGEATPEHDDLEGPHRQRRCQAYRHFVLWQYVSLSAPLVHAIQHLLSM